MTSAVKWRRHTGHFIGTRTTSLAAGAKGGPTKFRFSTPEAASDFELADFTMQRYLIGVAVETSASNIWIHNGLIDNVDRLFQQSNDGTVLENVLIENVRMTNAERGLARFKEARNVTIRQAEIFQRPEHTKQFPDAIATANFQTTNFTLEDCTLWDFRQIVGADDYENGGAVSFEELARIVKMLRVRMLRGSDGADLKGDADAELCESIDNNRPWRAWGNNDFVQCMVQNWRDCALWVGGGKGGLKLGHVVVDRMQFIDGPDSVNRPYVRIDENTSAASLTFKDPYDGNGDVIPEAVFRKRIKWDANKALKLNFEYSGQKKFVAPDRTPKPPVITVQFPDGLEPTPEVPIVTAPTPAQTSLELGNAPVPAVPLFGWSGYAIPELENQIIGTWLARSSWANLRDANWLGNNPDFDTYVTAHRERAADIGVPLVPHDSTVPVNTLLIEAFSGSHDAEYVAMGTNMARKGPDTVYARVWWEMNMRPQPADSIDRSLFQQAWRRAVPLIEYGFKNAAREGQKIYFGFCPISDGAAYEGFWPGDEYVDFCALDAYASRWGRQQPSSEELLTLVSGQLQKFTEFAASHGKPVALGEFGNWQTHGENTTSDDSRGRGDFPEYIKLVMDWAQANSALYVCYFNLSSGGVGLTLADTPNSLTLLQRRVKALSSPPVSEQDLVAKLTQERDLLQASLTRTEENLAVANENLVKAGDQLKYHQEKIQYFEVNLASMGVAVNKYKAALAEVVRLAVPRGGSTDKSTLINELRRIAQETLSSV